MENTEQFSVTKLNHKEMEAHGRYEDITGNVPDCRHISVQSGPFLVLLKKKKMNPCLLANKCSYSIGKYWEAPSS